MVRSLSVNKLMIFLVEDGFFAVGSSVGIQSPRRAPPLREPTYWPSDLAAPEPTTLESLGPPLYRFRHAPAASEHG